MSQPLKGLKAVELCWGVAGPLTGKILADHGTTVVRVEVKRRPDSSRSLPPFQDNISGMDRGYYYVELNSSKYCVCLDLEHPDSAQVMRELVCWADVVIESFTPGTLEKLGLGYDALSKMRPDIILLSSSGYGQEGPYARLAAYGTTLSGVAGFHPLTGWPDRGPSQAYQAYTDIIAPPFNVAALLAAIEYRRRTGKGQHLDIAQLECGLQFVAPAMVFHDITGQTLTRDGNRHPDAAPHAVYRCAGEDEWCAICVFDESEWLNLCAAMGKPYLATDPRFASVQARIEHESELAAAIEEWTGTLSPAQVTQTLQSAGVAAGAVLTGKGVFEDEQLRHYRHFRSMTRPEFGEYAAQSVPFHLSATPCEMSRPAPLLCQDTHFVLTELLGMHDERFMALTSENVIE